MLTTALPICFSRVSGLSNDDWCGPSPLCQHLQFLSESPRDSLLRLSGAQTKGRNHVCSTASSTDAKFPWPFFNEFGLETLLLRRWRSSLLACDREADGAACAAEADIVVIPSLYLHDAGFRGTNPWDENDADDSSESKNIFRNKRHRAYWEKVCGFNAYLRFLVLIDILVSYAC
jgi:hypothetical protein